MSRKKEALQMITLSERLKEYASEREHSLVTGVALLGVSALRYCVVCVDG